MGFEVEKRTDGGITTLVLKGCLDTAASPQFEAAVQEVGDVTSLVLDFQGLEFIASSGIRTLVSAQKRLSVKGASVVLEGLNDVVRDVFEVTGLLDVFTVR